MTTNGSKHDAEFSHLDDGVPEARWAAFGLDSVPVVAAPGEGATVLVVAAHPDDETLGAGGLIASAAAAGAEVRIVIASDGGASHPCSPTHSAQQLARRREAEAERAAAALGVAQVTQLGMSDGSLGEGVEELAASLAAACPRPSLIVAPWVRDGHPDHTAASRAAEQLARSSGATLWQYPIWVWHWLDPADASPPDADRPDADRARADRADADRPDADRAGADRAGADRAGADRADADPMAALPMRQLRRLPLTPSAITAKEAAIAAYVSQHQPLSSAPGDEAVLSESMVAHFRRPFETFVVPAPAESVGYFDALYRGSADPWGLGDRWYERRKRELILAALPRPRARRVFEPGCALGDLTVRLAERAGEVVAWDASPDAVRAARAALGAAGFDRSASVQQGRIPADWPAGTFDLIVLSEVGYYCADLALLVDRVAASLSVDGAVVACHWRHPAPDHPLSAEAVHRALAARLTRIAGYADGDFLLDVLSVDDRSVAELEGLVPARPSSAP